MWVKDEGRAKNRIEERRHKHIFKSSFRDSEMEETASRTGIIMEEFWKNKNVCKESEKRMRLACHLGNGMARYI